MATERQSPDALVEQTNLTGAVTAIDEDPDSSAGDWLTAPGSNNATVARVTFPTPTGPPTTGAGLQNFRALVRKTNHSTNPTCAIQLYENGSLVSEVLAATTVSSTTGVVLQGSWNATSLGTSNGSAVECRVVGAVGGGSPGNRASLEVGAIEWNVDYTAAATPTRGRVSWAELESPLVGTRGRLSFAELESPAGATRGLLSWAELEAPAAPTRGRVSWAEHESPLAPTRGRVSWAETETPVGATRGLLSFAEVEVPLAPTRGLLSWSEAQAPDLAVGDPTRGLLSFTEFEAPLSSTRGRISWAEGETPFTPTRARLSWAEVETPLTATRGRLSVAEIEAPGAPTRGLVSWAEMSGPDIGGAPQNNRFRYRYRYH